MSDTNVKNMRILVRRDTAQAWYDANPTLLIGEQGYETDQRGLKFGDGVTQWRDLPYFMGFGGIDGGSPELPFAGNEWPHVDYS